MSQDVVGLTNAMQSAVTYLFELLSAPATFAVGGGLGLAIVGKVVSILLR